MVVTDLEILKQVTVKEFNSFVDREVSNSNDTCTNAQYKSLGHETFTQLPCRAESEPGRLLTDLALTESEAV